MSQASTIAVRVVGIQQLTSEIKHFELAPVNAATLPAFSGGSHIVVVMHGTHRTHRNPYSLMSSPAELETYGITVRRMEQSRGGSRYLHDEVQVGNELEIAHPVNLFPLDKIARKHLLIARGIGITPFMAQLAELRMGNLPYELHYATRAPEHCAFGELLRQHEGSRMRQYYDCAGPGLNFHTLLADQPLGTHVYVCGPATMIAKVVDTSRELGWPDSHIHWEQFSAPPVGAAFQVHLARSNREVSVLPDSSLLESIEAAGVEVPYLCRGGVCGFCRTTVLEVDGELLHNDHFLSDEERLSGKAIMPCVSRARCRKLVLDL